MKIINKSALLGLVGTALIATQANGAVTLSSGDLAVAFYQVVSGAVSSNTYIFDLGQASNYRENTSSGLVSSISGGPASANIADDLVAAFGSGWANDGTVRWMVIGNVSSTSATINGDPARTSYLSRAASTVAATGPNTVFGSAISSTNRGTLSTNLTSVFNGINNDTSGANANGAIIPKTDAGTIDEFLPPTVATYFGLSATYSPYQTLAAGTITNNHSSAGTVGAIEGALDLYRVLHTATGADLTAGGSTGDATLGNGQYLGTLLLSSSGNLSIATIPEPSSALLGVAGALGFCLRRRRNA